MVHPRFVPLLLTVLALALVLGACAKSTPPQVQASLLVLTDSAGKELLVQRLEEGEEFGVRYIHSVAQSPVEDWFSIEGDTIYLEKTIFQDFGAGLPHEAGEGQIMDFGDGHISITDFHRALPTFDLRVGRVAQHTLLLGQDGDRREIPLNTLVRPGKAITFSARAAQ